MKFWDDIVNKASLGSAKAPLTTNDIPAAIVDEYELEVQEDAEENFFKIASLAGQYRRSGARPMNAGTIVQSEAAEEVKPYCSNESIAALKEIFAEELPPFLDLWLHQCISKNKIARPDVVPYLLELARDKKKLRNAIIEVCGRRGEWLSTLNPNWNFYVTTEDPQTIWETGSPDARKELLKTVRSENPAQGLELLKSTWATEGANEKVAFLEILKENVSAIDLAWLESLKEKGQKVNNAISDLIKLIPSSPLIQQYVDVLKQAFSIKSGKALLGMISKTTLTIDDAAPIPESVFKSGIDKLSSNKEVSDSQFIFAQLINAVPPSFWNEKLQMQNKDIITLFQKEKQHAFFLPAISIAAIRFKDQQWIKDLLDYGMETLGAGSVNVLVAALRGKDRDVYGTKMMKEYPAQIILLMLDNEEEWSSDLAKAILTFASKEIYQFNKTFFRPAAAKIPVEMLSKLDSFIPSDANKQPYWRTQSNELGRLLTLKQQTLQSFTA